PHPRIAARRAIGAQLLEMHPAQFLARLLGEFPDGGISQVFLHPLAAFSGARLYEASRQGPPALVRRHPTLHEQHVQPAVTNRERYHIDSDPNRVVRAGVVSLQELRLVLWHTRWPGHRIVHPLVILRLSNSQSKSNRRQWAVNTKRQWVAPGEGGPSRFGRTSVPSGWGTIKIHRDDGKGGQPWSRRGEKHSTRSLARAWPAPQPAQPARPAPPAQPQCPRSGLPTGNVTRLPTSCRQRSPRAASTTRSSTSACGQSSPRAPAAS